MKRSEARLSAYTSTIPPVCDVVLFPCSGGKASSTTEQPPSTTQNAEGANNANSSEHSSPKFLKGQTFSTFQCKIVFFVCPHKWRIPILNCHGEAALPHRHRFQVQSNLTSPKLGHGNQVRILKVWPTSEDGVFFTEHRTLWNAQAKDKKP